MLWADGGRETNRNWSRTPEDTSGVANSNLTLSDDIFAKNMFGMQQPNVKYLLLPVIKGLSTNNYPESAKSG